MTPEQLEAYLRHKLSTDKVTVGNLRRITGGASRETWSFDARWWDKGSEVVQGLIVRRDPDASLLETERDLEYRVYQALADTPVPVPRVYWLELDSAWLERPFFVMERVDGGQALPQTLGSASYDTVRTAIGTRKAEILASIHRVDWQSRDLGFLEPPSLQSCASIEIARWEHILDNQALDPEPILRAGFQWLKEHLPRSPERLVLVHGDYRTGNYLYTPDGRITAVLDWELAHLGDPMEDVGWLCMRSWRVGGSDDVGGVLDREEFFRLYEEHGGFEVDREAVRFWELLGNLKLAVILLTGSRSFCDGRTTNLLMASTGRSTGGLNVNALELMGVLEGYA